MILRTAATRFEFELDWLDLFLLFYFLDVRIDRRSVCDSEDKDVWIYICYVSGGPLNV